MKTKIYKPGNLNPLARKMLKDQRVSVVVENFLGVDWHQKTKVFPNFVVFKNPKDSRTSSSSGCSMGSSPPALSP